MTTPTNGKHSEAVVLHSGYRSNSATSPVAVPIFSNDPTNDVLEQQVASLKGANSRRGIEEHRCPRLAPGQSGETSAPGPEPTST